MMMLIMENNVESETINCTIGNLYCEVDELGTVIILYTVKNSSSYII